MRSEAKARKLEQLGIKTVLGSIQDTDVLESLASQSHIVFSIVCSASLHLMPRES